MSKLRITESQLKTLKSFLIYENENIKEEEENPCWDGYEMVGMKEKDGKEVPNCVPKESVGEKGDMISEEIPDRYKDKGFKEVGKKKQAPDGADHKWEVLAKKGDKYKIVKGGTRGMEDYSQHGDEERKEDFWNRMGGKNSADAKDPFSALYWHKKFDTW